jgi:hypothetical protein
MRAIFAAPLLICLIPNALLADDDNPFKKAKIGDWVEYKMTGPNVEGKTKMTIVAKDDDEVTYEVEATFSSLGKEMVAPTQKLKVDLTKSYDAISAANLSRTGTKIEKDGEGAEKIKIGDKEFDAKWTKLKCTTTVNDVTVVSDYKMWFCSEAPLSGLVRMETTTGMFTTKVELIGSGAK